MPENEFPENIHNFFEQDNPSQGHQFQVGSGGWPIFSNNPWVGTQRPNGAPVAFTKNYISHSLDSEQGNGMQPPFGSGPNLKPELIISQPRNQQLNLNGYMHSSQGPTNFQGDGLVSDSSSLMQRGFSNSTFEPQQSTAPGYISGLTRSSESSEATEAPVNFDFLGGQQLMQSPHPGISQPRPIQPQRINDMQLWQRQLMYKQLKEMQRNQQLQQLQQQGGRQQMSQASNNELPTVLSGMPIHNASNNIWSNEHVGSEGRLPSSSPMFISRMPMQGIPNGHIFSHDRGQAVKSMGFSLQQPDQSLYGTPVASTKGSLNHQSQFEGTNQSEKGSMQTSAFNYFQSNQNGDLRQSYVHDDISHPKHGQGAISGATSGNFQQMGQFSPSGQIQEMSGMLHEKIGEQVGPSRGVASLDPTEEKLLFSRDDHGNFMQSNDYFSEFSTINSGSWSALMQEAVEASSSDTGLNEEWSGLSFQKMEMSSGNHSVLLPDNNGNLQNASSLSSRPLSLFNEGNAIPNCHNDKPFDQSHQQKHLAGGIVQAQTQFSNNNLNNVWTGQMCEQLASSSHSSDNSHNMQHAWPQQQSVPLQSHPANLLNGWNSQSLGATGGNDPKSYDNNDMKSTMNMEGDHKGSMWMVTGNQVPTFLSNSAGRRTTFGSDTGSHMQNEDSGVGNLAAIMNSNNLNMNQETNQQMLSSHQADYRKHAIDAYLNSKKEETTNKYQNQLSRTPQSWDSSMYAANKQENNHQEEGLNEGFVNNSQPGQNSEVGSSARESSVLAGNEVRPLVNSSLKSSSQTGHENMGPRRFQFHPMGKLEMSTEPMGSQNHISYPQGSSQSVVQGLKNQEQGYSAQSQVAGHVLNNFLDIGKGQSSDLKRNAEAMDGIQNRGTSSSHPAIPVIDGFPSQFSQNNKTGPTSQNMLELLHKVDQSRVGKTVERFGFFKHSTPSGGAERDASDGSAANLQLSQSSALQGFGLKLGPPSQRQSLSNDFNRRNLDSGTREDNQTKASFNSGHDASEKENPSNNKSFLSRHKSKEVMYSAASNNLRMNQSIMQQQQQQLHFPFASGPKPNDELANLPFGTQVGIDAKKGQGSHIEAKSDQSATAGGIPPSRLIPSASKFNPGNAGRFQHGNSSSHLGSSGQQGGFSTMLHNVWTNVSSQQRASGVHPQNIISNVLQSMSPSPAGREMNLAVPQKPDNPNKRKGERPSNSDHYSSQQLSQSDFDPKRGSALSREPEQKNHSDKSKGKYTPDSAIEPRKGQVSVSSIASSNRDPPESSDVHNQNNYSLLQQMQAMKDADSDLSRRDAKRLKGEDFGTDTSGRRYMYGQNTVSREMDATSQNILCPSSDLKMLSFSSRESKENSANTSLQQDDLRNHSHPHGKSPLLPQISPQMAPSWFEKYGNYKNGQILTYDGRGSSQRIAMAAHPNYPSSKVSESTVLKDDVASAPAGDAYHSGTSPSHPSLELIVNNNVSLIPKKRKSATSDLIPWHKSVTEGCQRLQSISITEQQWVRATNRLIDKLEEEPDLIEDGPSRSRRRLVLTTQLMQQILPSIPAAYVITDAATSYESVIYFMAKLILREACSLTSCSGSDSRVDSDSGDTISGKLITYRKEGSSHFSRFVEDFIGRLKMLEDDFLRLEKRTYILDTRLECQELKRFSIMNRFAKFHGRAQSEGGEGSSSTADPALRRPFLQRHVTAHAMPRNLPEGVICLSL